MQAKPTDPSRQADVYAEIEITPEMIEAGAAVLADFAGEATKWRLAEMIYQAMQSVVCLDGAGRQKKPL